MTKRTIKDKIKHLIAQQAAEKWSRIVLPFIITPIKKGTNWGLTLKERAILTLRMFGFTPKEISQLLKITRGNTKTITSRIKRKLGFSIDEKMPKL